jgi:hypothetical protein
VIEEAVIAGGAADGGILWRGPEEPERSQGAVGGLLAGDPGALDADGVGGEREADGGDARELLGRPAIRRETVCGRRAFPEEVEGAVLERIEESDGVGRDARAPGVVGEATPEGQDEDGGGEAGAITRQNVYSAPTWKRRGSITMPPIVPLLL